MNNSNEKLIYDEIICDEGKDIDEIIEEFKINPADEENIPDALFKRDIVNYNGKEMVVIPNGIVENDSACYIECAVRTINDFISITMRDLLNEEIESNIVILAPDYIREKVREKKFVKDLSDILDITQIADSFEVNSKDFEKEREKLFNFLLMIKSDKNKQIVDKGISLFYSNIMDRVSQDIVEFGDKPYKIRRGNDKKYKLNEFMSKLLNSKLIDYNFLVEEGIISNLTRYELETLFKDKLSEEEFVNALIISNNIESKEDLLKQFISEGKIKDFMRYANSEEVAKALISGKIDSKVAIKKLGKSDIKEFDSELLEELLTVNNYPKNRSFIQFVKNDTNVQRFIDKDFLLSLDREKFLRLIFSNKIKYKNPLKSSDYISCYGKLNSNDIINLSDNGLVNSEDVIKMIRFSSIKVQDENEYNSMISNLINYYTVDRLEKILKEGRDTARFSEDFNLFLDENLTEDQKKEYFKTLTDSLKKKENGDDILITLIKKGINISGNLDYEIKLESLRNMYLNEEISEEDLLNLYNKKFIGMEELNDFFTKDEIIQRVQNHEINNKFLLFLNDRETIIKNELNAERMDISQALDLYFDENGLKIDELNQVLKGRDFLNENIIEIIPDTISTQKIKELFMNYYISHDDLSYLVERGLITKEDADEFAKELANNEEYEKLFKNEDGMVVLTSETESDYKNKGYKKIRNHKTKKFKIDPDLQEEFLDNIGFDKRRLYFTGNKNSLDGYTIYPSKELEIMIFLNKQKPQNATYVMSLQQGLFFLNKIKKTNNSQESEYIESEATKKLLRETEHVKVKNSCRGWGKNVIDALRSLSPELRERFKNDEYNKKINDIIEKIKEDYDLRKE